MKQPKRASKRTGEEERQDNKLALQSGDGYVILFALGLKSTQSRATGPEVTSGWTFTLSVNLTNTKVEQNVGGRINFKGGDAWSWTFLYLV